MKTRPPWHVSDEDASEIFDANNRLIAQVIERVDVDPSSDLTKGEAEAIATLMAAAPDLYAACKMLLRGYGSADNPFRCEVHMTAQEMGKLRAAIAKAESTPSPAV